MRLPAIIAAALIAAPAVAQDSSQCTLAPVMVKFLTDEVGIEPRAIGLANGKAFHWWGDEESGRWAVTVMTPEGIMCILLAGEDFAPIAPTPPGEAM